MTLDHCTRFSRRAFVVASAATLLPFCVRVALADLAEQIVEPGVDLGSVVAKASAGGVVRKIRLKPGLYGPLSLGRIKSDIEIVGDPGAIVGQTVLRSSSGIHFRNIAFRGGRGVGDSMPALVQTSPDSSDIRFSDCSFATVEDVGSWRDVDWAERPFLIGLLVRAPNVRLAGCRFFHLRNCLALSGNDAVVKNCLFENFGNDGIEFGANNLRISNNIVRGGHHTPAETQHADGMQGFPAPKGGVFSNIVIERNRIEFAGPGDYMQGITIFDGRWRNVRVADNTVSVNVWNAIALYGIDGVVVENNTVSSTDPKIQNWIEVRASKSGVSSTDVVIRNNVAPLVKSPPGAKVADNRNPAAR